MDVSRRAFLKNGGVAMIGMSTLPAFLQRAIAATPASNRKKLEGEWPWTCHGEHF